MNIDILGPRIILFIVDISFFSLMEMHEKNKEMIPQYKIFFVRIPTEKLNQLAHR